MTPEQIRDAWNAQADEYNQWDTLSWQEIVKWSIQCVQEKLAEKQEPVAWMYEVNGMPQVTFCDQREVEKAHPELKPSKSLFIIPPPREWVGLTDKELEEFSDAKLGSYDLCLAVEEKLKEKNT